MGFALMLLSSIEKILNRSLPRSPRAQALAAELAGRSLAVTVTGADPVILSSTGERLRLQRSAGTAADASISAGPFSLLALASGQTRNVSASGGTVSGDAEIAQRFSELLALLKPDPEEELAQLLGDAPAHHLGRLARAAVDFGDHAARQIRDHRNRPSRPRNGRHTYESRAPFRAFLPAHLPQQFLHAVRVGRARPRIPRGKDSRRAVEHWYY